MWLTRCIFCRVNALGGRLAVRRTLTVFLGVLFAGALLLAVPVSAEDPTAQIRVQAVDGTTGEPHPEVRVYLDWVDQGLFMTDDGWFTVDVQPDSTVTFAARVDAIWTTQWIDTPAAGELLVVDSPIEVTPITLTGMVVDPLGEPLAGVLVDIADGRTQAVLRSTFTDSDGEYSIRPVDPEGWRIEFTPPPARPELVPVWLEESDFRRFEVENPDGFDVVLPEGMWIPASTERTMPTAANPITVAVQSFEAGGGTRIFASSDDDGDPRWDIASRRVDTPLFDIHESVIPEGTVPTGCDNCSRLGTTLGPWGYQVLPVYDFIEVVDSEPPPYVDPPLASSAPSEFTISTVDGCAAAFYLQLRWYAGEMGPRPDDAYPELPTTIPMEAVLTSYGGYTVTYRLDIGSHSYDIFVGLEGANGPDWRIGSGAPTCPDGSGPAAREGYVVLSERGGVYQFGTIPDVGSAGVGAASASAVALTSRGDGYWVLDTSGRVHNLGSARQFGGLDIQSLKPGESPTTVAATPGDDGYWIVTNFGRVVPFGSARSLGDLSAFDLAGEIIDAAATPSGNGYYLVGSDGGIFAFGDAKFIDSIPGVLPGVKLDQPIVGLTPDPDADGYWLVAADGGVFAFNAPFRGSIPGVLPPGAQLVASINGMVPYGNGYLLVAGDGGVFNFSNLAFEGSLADVELTSAIVAIAAT